MQQNSAESSLKLSKSENVIQPTTTTTNSAQLPRAPYNPRFALTPVTMGMNIRSDSSATSRIQQLPPPTTPEVDVKSYYERHSGNYPVGAFTDSKQTLQSSHPYTPAHSLRGADPCLVMDANNGGELIAQSPSPISSPQTPQQQWNFEYTTTHENLQLHAKAPADNHHLLLKCAEVSKKRGGQTPGNTSAVSPSPNSPSMSDEQTQGHDCCSNDSAKLNFQILNNIYAKRIEDIDANAWGDKDLKIFTYQEWVEFLVKINESFLSSIEELEREVASRLEFMQRRVNSNCRHSQGDDIMKCRKDIDTLLKYIKNNNNNNNKSCDFLVGLTLETLTPDQVRLRLDFENLHVEDNAGDEIKSYNDNDMVQRNKLYANMKALAQEVAEKHDEVRELKRQVVCLENEIQKAQKKIQLKEDVIKELRNDLKCANNKIPTSPSLETSLSMPPINIENQIPCSANTHSTDNTSTFQPNNGSQFDFLSHSEEEEQQKIRILQEEINDLLQISDLNKMHIEQQLKKVKEVIKKVVSEKLDACKKLDLIRQQLIELESESSEGKSDCDSGFRSNSENDQNTRLLDTIRQRLRRRHDLICELKKKNQKLELDINEVSARLQTEVSFSGRSSDILKEVADLLCDLRGKQFSYTEMYNRDPSRMNSFCEAIMEMQKDFKAREAQLLEELKSKDQEVEELTELLFKNEKDFTQERTNLNDFKATQLSGTLPPPSLQQPSTLATTGIKPPPTSSTELQSDNIPVTNLQQVLEESL